MSNDFDLEAKFGALSGQIRIQGVILRSESGRNNEESCVAKVADFLLQITPVDDICSHLLALLNAECSIFPLVLLDVHGKWLVDSMDVNGSFLTINHGG